MGEKLTPQQYEAVVNRGGPLLVSAAAGSGKTKVLVDRLMGYICDPVMPANIDDFLIITYTKAAAAELRGKIAAKLSERIAQEPENRHLQQQMQRLYLAKISTVHAFCGDILREYAYRLDIPADFRVADENECAELQVQAIQQVLEESYSQDNLTDAFYCFVDSQGFGRDDRQIPEIVLKVYNSAMCHLDPDQWLDWCLATNSSDSVTDAAQTVWGRYLMQDLKDYLRLQIRALQWCADQASQADEMTKPAQVIAATVDQLVALLNCRSWDDVIQYKDIDYGRLTFSKKCTDLELVDQIKAVRDSCKKHLTNKLKLFSDSSIQILDDLSHLADAAKGLVDLARDFNVKYKKLKLTKHIVDFSDLEHLTLDLFMGKKRDAVTNTAIEVGKRFREVMVDEYQDSNQVQDAIFSALTSAEKNIFMVGDVKQSIYQFRLADPNIFLEKYNQFVSAEQAVDPEGRKVLLSSNFRSSGGVIRAVNDVFSICMSPIVGGLEYGADEQLNEGVTHIPLPESEVELYGINVNEDTYAEESAFVADKIAQLLDGTHMIRDGDGLRPIRPEDIVILMRSPGSVGGEFQRAIEEKGIHCVTGGTSDLLQSEEIEVLCSFLKIIQNPLQDIPLISVLASRVIGYTADELAELRANHRYGSIYSALQADPSEKSKSFLKLLMALRMDSQMHSITGLLNQILVRTGLDSIYAAMDDGAVRLENIQYFSQLAVKFEATDGCTLIQFLRHLEVLREKGYSVPVNNGNSGAVTIMSIHKSKGLEFPVVLLTCLSKSFNQESAKAQVLCDKELGLGLTCVDTENRVRYPSIAKKAIAAKIIADGISEEMRVLYVAMTRARDRLIMTYASSNLDKELADISLRMKACDKLLMTKDVNCPGAWVLLTAVMNRDNDWTVQPGILSDENDALESDDAINEIVTDRIISKLKASLAYVYPFKSATTIPSKQTATQLKGRIKDQEVAQDTFASSARLDRWNAPTFAAAKKDGKDYGNLIHTVMQHICYRSCNDVNGVCNELQRLVQAGYITSEDMKRISPEIIADFFTTSIGQQLMSAGNVLREFKFSVLDDAEKYYPGTENEQILLQGVVDCAIIEDDGITVLDFKSDNVNNDNLSDKAEQYRLQISVYAQALERIYQKPIKGAFLYFFKTRSFVQMK